MKDVLISAYIDDELSLDDKIVFVETVHEARHFKEQAVELLNQEILLRGDVVVQAPAVEITRTKVRNWRLFGPFTAVAAGLTVAALLILVWFPREFRPDEVRTLQPHRFVIFQPGAERVELAGSFSAWQKIPLTHSGNSGYWEITLELPGGDHRFSYIIEGNRRLPDPTIVVRETDDFGGENSILTLKQKT